MKNAVMILVSGFLGILTLAVVLTIGGAMNRRNELQSSLSSAMEETVEQTVSDADLLERDMSAVASCVEAMTLSADADSHITAEVYRADMQKGVLTMKFVEDFMHPNGDDGRAEWERTVIYNQLETEEQESYEVRFYLNREMMPDEEACYKTCRVLSGERITPPAEPQGEGLSFEGWMDTNGYMADFSQPVNQNLSYYAAWE